jgi:hypothetical protein
MYVIERVNTRHLATIDWEVDFRAFESFFVCA